MPYDGEILVAAREIGIIQVVVGHGVDPALIEGFSRRAGRLLSLPRAEKANLASPTGHPHRGWRQWPDDFGRLARPGTVSSRAAR